MKKKLYDGKGKILSPNLFPVVGVGASAGGLEAFKTFIKAIPENCGIAFVLVQHLDPNHESILTDLLQKLTTIPVLEITDDIRVQPNHIYIIPSNKLLIANDGILMLSARPSFNKKEKNLPIDVFFISLAEVHQSHAIGVVLSGTASDGTQGLRSIRDHGGLTFAQDEASAAYSGMPASAAKAGVVDFILPPDQIPMKILELHKSLHLVDGDQQDIPLREENAFKQILTLLRLQKGTDFSYYRKTTIYRRILRRIAFNKIETRTAYLDFVRSNKSEQDLLYQDLLIPVTTFFRDPKSFDHLCAKVIPLIVKGKTKGESIRIWVTACSTGEEAYSIAICFHELLTTNLQKIQIFATDISQPAIIKARAGIYTESELNGVSESRLKAYFTRNNDSTYTVIKQLREICVFAEHNFLQDPPFRRMDFISCRNVLIYMEPYLQKKALTTFHYALNQKGFLFLGRTETTNSVNDLFTLLKKNEKLYSRNDVPIKYNHTASPKGKGKEQSNAAILKSEMVHNDYQKIADEIILSKYAPAGVIVNELLEIVQYRGNTSMYLEQLHGKPSHNLLKLAAHGLGFELRNVLHKAKKENAKVSKENIHLPIDGKVFTISITAIPLSNTVEPYYLVLFHDHQSIAKKQLAAAGKEKSNSKGKTKTDHRDVRIQQLEQELAQTHEDMRSITDDQEATNEVLQSDNEELSSSSEELQSLNEELETSKEELQSSNEELLIVNQEMVTLNEQLKAARDYAETIVGTTREPLLVLDKNLRIKTANRSFYETFHMNSAATEGKLIYDMANQQWNIPSLRNVLEKIVSESKSFFDFEVVHHFQNLGTRILLLNGREMAGEVAEEKLILLAMEDVTDLASARKKMQAQADMVTQLMLTAPAFICTLRGPLHIYEMVNERYQQIFGKRKLKGKPILEALPELAGQGFDTLLHKVYNTGETYVGIDIPMYLARDENREPELVYFNLSYQPMYDEDKNIFSILVFGYEVTSQVLAKNKLYELQQLHSKELEGKVAQRTQELHFANELLRRKNEELQFRNKELNSFTYVSSHDLQEPLRKIQIFAKRLLEEENMNLSDKGKEYYRRIASSAQKMQTLIEDLLAFSRISSGELKFEVIDLSQMVEEVKAELIETIEEKNVIIEIKALCDVYIIKYQIHQLLLNLIGNAIKFTKPGVPAYIIIESVKITSESSIHKLKPGIAYCHFRIKDNGIGFDPQYQDKVFELFQRLNSSYEGNGMGLSIVKKIVENHNGFIFATGELNVGTTFDIYIPVSPDGQ